MHHFLQTPGVPRKVASKTETSTQAPRPRLSLRSGLVASNTQLSHSWASHPPSERNRARLTVAALAAVTTHTYYAVLMSTGLALLAAALLWS